ncbi:hypothetical protein C7B76_04990, partial [filamentous cyanobacterium CCP2]
SNFSLRLDRLKANANVMLMNGQGKMMMQSKRPKRQPETINMNALGAGTYYVKVFPARRKDKTRYQLRLSAIEIPRPQPVKPVNTTSDNTSNTEQTQPPKNEGGKSRQIALTGDVAQTGPIKLTGSVNRLIRGTLGNDTLRGEAGNDVIEGYNGFDTLTGGAGADRFVLGNTTTPYYLGSGYALITDFSSAQGDRIEITDNIFYPLSGYDFRHKRSIGFNAFGQLVDFGTAEFDTEIYWQNDLLAIVQDAIVTL